MCVCVCVCLFLASFAFVALFLSLFSLLSWRSLLVCLLSVWPRCSSPPWWLVACLFVPVDVVWRCGPLVVWFWCLLRCSCLFPCRCWFLGPVGFLSLGPFVRRSVCLWSSLSCFLFWLPLFTYSLLQMNENQQICRNSCG